MSANPTDLIPEPQQTAVAKKDGPPPATVNAGGVVIDNLETLWWMCNRVIQSGLAPKDCKTPADALIRAQMGMELGLSFMYSIQNIANINGRPSLWGDAIPALVMRSPLCEMFCGEYVGDGDTYGYQVTAKRKGQPEKSVCFTVGDAKKAGLWGKNVWNVYPKDMLRHKSATRAAKIHFPDLLGGLQIVEDIREVIPVNATELQPTAPRTLADVVKKMQAQCPEVEGINSTPDPPFEDDSDPDIGFATGASSPTDHIPNLDADNAAAERDGLLTELHEALPKLTKKEQATALEGAGIMSTPDMATIEQLRAAFAGVLAVLKTRK